MIPETSKGFYCSEYTSRIIEATFEYFQIITSASTTGEMDQLRIPIYSIVNLAKRSQSEDGERRLGGGERFRVPLVGNGGALIA